MKRATENSMGWRLIASGLLLFVWACTLNPEASLNHEPKTRESAMNNEHQSDSPPAIPPIDAAATAKVETATFGLG
jgi:hypothetical protein